LVGRPRDDVERIEADRRRRTPPREHVLDPCGAVGRHETQRRRTLRAKAIEEPLERRFVSSLLHPHHARRLVIDHDGQVALAATEAHLVDPDLPQPVQAIDGSRPFFHDPADDPTDRSPRDAHQLGQRRLRHVNRQPGTLLLEVFREARVVPSPRHPRHHDPVPAAAHPWRLCFDERQRRSQIQGSPPPSAFALVIEAAAPTAHATASALSPPNPHPRHRRASLVQLHRLHHGARDAEQTSPYNGLAHVPPPAEPTVCKPILAGRRDVRPTSIHAPSVSTLNPRKRQGSLKKAAAFFAKESQ
jgi:hypothetical protein